MGKPRPARVRSLKLDLHVWFVQKFWTRTYMPFYMSYFKLVLYLHVWCLHSRNSIIRLNFKYFFVKNLQGRKIRLRTFLFKHLQIFNMKSVLEQVAHICCLSVSMSVYVQQVKMHQTKEVTKVN